MRLNLTFRILRTLLFLLSLSVFACNAYGALPAAPGEVDIEVSYIKGSANFSSSIVYVIWIENESENYIQNLYVCNSVLGIGKTLTGTALPYWMMNKYPISEVDGVTGATQKNTDFSITQALADNTVRQFKIYMEVDHSFDSNDWFNDQPALLYSSDIDLDNLQPEYTLVPVGWTRNDNESGSTSNKFKDDPPHTSPTIGELQTELRYLTNRMEGTGFGEEYTDNTPATSIVGSLKAIITIAPDDIPPTIPTNLSGTAASGSVINLAWTASTDNVGVTGYRIYRTGYSTHVATSTTNSWSDTGLTELKHYTYAVTAYDAVGNESEPCTAIEVITQPADLITIVDQIFNESADTCIGALQDIEIGGDGNKVEFQSGSLVNLIAGNSIQLLPETYIQEGATVHAAITGDSTFCDQSESPVVRVNPIEKAVKTVATAELKVKCMDERQLEIYPNPGKGRFTIESTNFKNQVTISIINMLGTIIVPRQIIPSTRFVIDLSTRSKGIYIVRVSDGERVINRRIVLR